MLLVRRYNKDVESSAYNDNSTLIFLVNSLGVFNERVLRMGDNGSRPAFFVFISLHYFKVLKYIIGV